MSKKLCLFLLMVISHGWFTAIAFPQTEMGDCSRMEIIKAIKRSFGKITPQYISASVSVAIPTEGPRSIIFSAADPRLPQFLQDYIEIAKTIIEGREMDKHNIKFSMLTVLAYEYSQFLWRYGQSVICVSYFLGVVNDYGVVANIQNYAKYLKTRFEPRIAEKYDSKTFRPLKGNEILRKLGVHRSPIKVAADSPKDLACKEVIIPANDGDKVFVKFPTVKELPVRISIPGVSGEINTDSDNITSKLELYFLNAMTCLKTEDLRVGFSQIFAEWMSNKLVPGILRAPVCVQGFHRILNLLALVDAYVDISVKPKPGIKSKEPPSGHRGPLEYDVAPYVKINKDSNDASSTSDEPTVILMTAGHIVLLLFFIFLFPVFAILYCIYFRSSSQRLRTSIRQFFTKLFQRYPKRHEQRTTVDNTPVKPIIKRKYQKIKRRGAEETDSQEEKSFASDGANTGFRQTSRDIYIQLKEFPLEISTEEMDYVDDCSDKIMSSVNEFSVLNCSSATQNTRQSTKTLKHSERRASKYAVLDSELPSSTDTAEDSSS